jgi:hypothetical protein
METSGMVPVPRVSPPFGVGFEAKFSKGFGMWEVNGEDGVYLIVSTDESERDSGFVVF